MRDDLHDVLVMAAGEPQRPVDVDAALRRGDQLRRRRLVTWVASTTAAIAAVAVVGMGVVPMSPTISTMPPADSPPSAPTASTPAATGPTASASGSTADARDLDALVAEGVVGQDLAETAEPDAFHPAMLVGPGQYAWYMNEPGFTERIPEERVDALCAWADRQDDLHEAYNAEVREHSPVRGSDGGPMIVQEVCAGGVPRSWADAAADGRLAPGGRSCEVFADADVVRFPSEEAVGACKRHEQMLSADTEGPPTHIGSASGVLQITLSDPAACDWIVDEVGGVDNLGELHTDGSGTTFVAPSDAITDAVESVGAATNAGTLGTLANRCHPQSDFER